MVVAFNWQEENVYWELPKWVVSDFFPTLYQSTTVLHRNFQTVAALVLYPNGSRGTASEVRHALLTLKHYFLLFSNS